mmetsp:Transcript_15359/g.31156  ORF Transcript_15359/g.31156 Transcript_15359/m.31156 type:complete len:96 (-) Transcript_15359:1291-1578(-)
MHMSDRHAMWLRKALLQVTDRGERNSADELCRRSTGGTVRNGEASAKKVRRWAKEDFFLSLRLAWMALLVSGRPEGIFPPFPLKFAYKDVQSRGN